MRATFFCDESGYTGPNWGDREQRIFVHGGWLVPSSEAAAVSEKMASLKRELRLIAPELKSSQIQKRNEAPEIFRAFFRAALEGGCLPFFVAADKDYLLAAKAVETYFDPLYNHMLPMAFTANAGRKKKIADALVNAPEMLDRFSSFLRGGVQPSAEEVRRVGADIATHLHTEGQGWAASRLPDFTTPEIADMQAEFEADVWMRTTTGHTLWVLPNLLQPFLERHGGTASFIHDSLVRFDDLLESVRGMLRPASGPPIQLADGREILTGFPRITTLELADSRDEPLLQLADLLCGHVRHIFTKLKKDLPLSPEERATCLDLFVVQHEFHTWEFNTSLALQQRFHGVA